MSATIAPMPRKKSSGMGAPGGTETIRIDADLARMATLIAISRKQTVGELVSGHLRPYLEREYAKALAELQAEHEAKRRQ